MMDVMVVRAPKKCACHGPGWYEIKYDIELRPDGTAAARTMPWIVARKVLSPDEFHTLASASFADWCRRNGYPEEATG